jgi:hypothetical protein
VNSNSFDHEPNDIISTGPITNSAITNRTEPSEQDGHPIGIIGMADRELSGADLATHNITSPHPFLSDRIRGDIRLNSQILVDLKIHLTCPNSRE